MKMLKKLLGVIVIGVALCATGCGEKAVESTPKPTTTPKASEKIKETEAPKETEAVEEEIKEEVVEEEIEEEVVDEAVEEEIVDESNSAILETNYYTCTIPEGYAVLEQSTDEEITIVNSENQAITIMIVPVKEEYVGMSLEEIATITNDGMLATGQWTNCDTVVDTLPFGEAVLCQAMGGLSLEQLQSDIESGAVTIEEIEAKGGAEEYVKPFMYSASTVQYIGEEFCLAASVTTKPGEEYDGLMMVFEKIIESIVLK